MFLTLQLLQSNLNAYFHYGKIQIFVIWVLSYACLAIYNMNSVSFYDLRINPMRFHAKRNLVCLFYLRLSPLIGSPHESAHKFNIVIPCALIKINIKNLKHHSILLCLSSTSLNILKHATRDDDFSASPPRNIK